MLRQLFSFAALVVCLAVVSEAVVSESAAQQPDAAKKAAPKKGAPKKEEQLAGKTDRVLAPGVLTVIKPDSTKGEVADAPIKLIEVAQGKPGLKWMPKFSSESSTLFWKAQQINLRRDIWCFEFAFKPLRMVEVDIPQKSGRMARKKVWYMVYRVRYTGSDLKPNEGTQYAAKGTFTIGKQDYTHRWFFPQFVLEAPNLKKAYLDRLVPSAMKKIQDREVEGHRLLNTVEITERRIELSTPGNDKSVWGVVAWEDIDPRVDHLSLYITGLTNAYRFNNDPSFKPGDGPGKGRTYATKTLRLNFFRPGDSVLEHEEEIRFGVPSYKEKVKQETVLQKYGLNERLDYLWIYR